MRAILTVALVAAIAMPALAHDDAADLAYAFASSAGYGAGLERGQADCEAIAARCEEIKAKFDITDLDLAGQQ